MTFADCLKRHVDSRRGKVSALKRLEEAIIPLHEGLGHLRIDQINQREWDRYAATRFKKKGGKLTANLVLPGTLRREFNVLRATFRRAWKDEFLVRPPEIEPPRDSAPRDRFLTKAEAKKLLDACETPHVRTFMAFAIYTGARKGSILALTWDRVHWQTGLIDFQEPRRTLTGKRRAIVPMTKALQKEMEETFKLSNGDYVVHWHGKPISNGLRWSFNKACERAGLTWRPTPHHLKHSVASWFAMDKVPIDQAADWLATDPDTLRRVYRKFDLSYLRSIADDFEL
ncbi:MAG: site-specific integrase [Gluconobacter potus]|uniref:Site-specific integrase n=1 Tax=Gluconobacter potus TaxID=2724927 RepID=A0ABR9YJU0_9PROT|nr:MULTISPECIES: site-specific integrase [Gluconobacter]MBF0864226.1 site-specific integrase [Gluconobacter sp. R71656]MBF0867892.1 site-specific integrase [Gluconobacter sp. R75628]MBF0872817.1 site-specific integrase [Gluconobacter sp. R75629]MBF0882063.1 site-specific integrase [Gluconobacter potus]